MAELKMKPIEKVPLLLDSPSSSSIIVVIEQSESELASAEQQQQQQQRSKGFISPDALALIFEFCFGFKDLLSFSLVNSTWSAVALSDRFWIRIVQQHNDSPYLIERYCHARLRKQLLNPISPAAISIANRLPSQRRSLSNHITTSLATFRIQKKQSDPSFRHAFVRSIRQLDLIAGRIITQQAEQNRRRTLQEHLERFARPVCWALKIASLVCAQSSVILFAFPTFPAFLPRLTLSFALWHIAILCLLGCCLYQVALDRVRGYTESVLARTLLWALSFLAIFGVLLHLKLSFGGGGGDDGGGGGAAVYTDQKNNDCWIQIQIRIRRIHVPFTVAFMFLAAFFLTISAHMIRVHYRLYQESLYDMYRGRRETSTKLRVLDHVFKDNLWLTLISLSPLPLALSSVLVGVCFDLTDAQVDLSYVTFNLGLLGAMAPSMLVELVAGFVMPLQITLLRLSEMAHERGMSTSPLFMRDMRSLMRGYSIRKLQCVLATAATLSLFAFQLLVSFHGRVGLFSVVPASILTLSLYALMILYDVKPITLRSI